MLGDEILLRWLPKLEMVLMYDMTVNEIIMKKAEKAEGGDEDLDNQSEQKRKVEKLLETRRMIDLDRKKRNNQKRLDLINKVISIVLNLLYFINILAFCLIQIQSSEIFEMNL